MIDSIKNWFEQYPLVLDIVQVLGVLFLAGITYIIVKKILVRAVKTVVGKTKNTIR
jgi:hypothetical protein